MNSYMNNHKVLNVKPNEMGIAKNKNITLALIFLGIIRNRSTTLNIKILWNYQNNFGKSKRALEY